MSRSYRDTDAYRRSCNPGFPLPYSSARTVIREGATFATLHHPDGRREVVHPSAYAERDLERRRFASGMVS